MNFYNPQENKDGVDSGQQQQFYPQQSSQMPQQRSGPGSEYFKFQNVSPEMLNFGLNAGQDIINKQRDKWMPGVSGFWLSLKYYFSVSNSYVLKKLMVVLYPIANKVWNRIQADEFQRDGEVSSEGFMMATPSPSAQLPPQHDITIETEAYSRKWALPKQDFNAPDLYIPLMSFMTYVLLYGLGRGLGSAEFTPDTLIQAIWRCLILQCIESGMIKFGVNMLSVNVPYMDIFAYTGYKYVALCLNCLARALGSLSFLVTMFTASMLAYFMLKTMAAVVPPATTTGPPRHLLLLGFAALQFLVILILSFT